MKELLGKRVVLASASPRRKELLKLLTDDFEIVPSDAEDMSKVDTSDPKKIPIQLSEQKCRDVVNRCSPDENTVVIGCDTVVADADGRLMGKPVDGEDAFRMLKSLSGKKSVAVSGVCVYYRDNFHSFSQTTEVRFYQLTDGEIEEYIKSGEPFGKAGAYAIQGQGSLFIKEIHGDYNNVVGLPTSLLSRKLKEIL